MAPSSHSNYRLRKNRAGPAPAGHCQNTDFELAAVSSQRGVEAAGARSFRSHEQLFAGTPGLHAVAICTPPQPRYAIARAALAAGLHVMLEKPPTATLSELADLHHFAEERGLVLMTTWHSQYNAGVDEAKRLLANREVQRLFVNWKEDVRKWHPARPGSGKPEVLGFLIPASTPCRS
jgi:D-galactose 1-dehydrogenase